MTVMNPSGFFLISYLIIKLIIIHKVKIAFDAKEYNQLNDLIKLLARKRGQPKKGLIDMIQLCMKFIDQLPSMNQKLTLIHTIKEVTEKKIFLEVSPTSE